METYSNSNLNQEKSSFLSHDRALAPDRASLSTIQCIAVNSIDVFVKALASAGGNPVVSRITIPGVGHYAYCRDAQDDPIGLFEVDTTA